MRKIIILLALTLSALVSLGSSASAVGLSLHSSFPETPIGGVISVDVMVHGLGEFAPESLGGFYLDIGYDPLILAIADTDVTFGPLLGDPLAFEADMFASVFGGVVTLEETSWLFDFELDAIQPASFVLATLDFTGLAPGISPLDILVADLSNAYGFIIPAVSVGEASVMVRGSGAAVPEPAALMLLAMGVAGLAGFRRRLLRA